MKIAVIGAGNVATHLARALGGFNEICQVAARTDQSAGRLASLVDAASEGNRMHGGACEPIAGLDRLRDDMDMYLVAVNDDSVADVVAGRATSTAYGHIPPAVWGWMSSKGKNAITECSIHCRLSQKMWMSISATYRC